jgi:formylmethanofuran dehydrogenase subunit E
MRTFDELIADATAMHRGYLCPGQVLGVRMAMLACQLLGINEPIREKHLIVYVEIDRCMADAIAAVTGCRLGKRTLKHIDYGKCACTFVDGLTSRAIRIVARDDAREHVWDYVSSRLKKSEAQCEAYKIMPNERLFSIQEVKVDIPEHDQPGPPINRVVCSICGEGINDRREVQIDGQVLCRACVQGAYYKKLEKHGYHMSEKLRTLTS